MKTSEQKQEYLAEKLSRTKLRKDKKKEKHKLVDCENCGKNPTRKTHFCPLDSEFGNYKICNCCYTCSEACAMNI